MIDRDEALGLSGVHLARLHAEQLCHAIVLAAEVHPELLRDALRKVFSLECVEAMTLRIQTNMAKAMWYAERASRKVSSSHRRTEELEKRIDALTYEIERLERKQA